jgi:hypothetical protein
MKPKQARLKSGITHKRSQPAASSKQQLEPNFKQIMYSPLSGKHEIFIRKTESVAFKIPHTPGRVRKVGLGGFMMDPEAPLSSTVILHPKEDVP